MMATIKLLNRQCTMCTLQHLGTVRWWWGRAGWWISLLLLFFTAFLNFDLCWWRVVRGLLYRDFASLSDLNDLQIDSERVERYRKYTQGLATLSSHTTHSPHNKHTPSRCYLYIILIEDKQCSFVAMVTTVVGSREQCRDKRKGEGLNTIVRVGKGHTLFFALVGSDNSCKLIGY